MATYTPACIIVTYGVDSLSSYNYVEEILQYLWKMDVLSNHAIIVVANKTDLVRTRKVSTDGKFYTTRG